MKNQVFSYIRKLLRPNRCANFTYVKLAQNKFTKKSVIKNKISIKILTYLKGLMKIDLIE
mgnify:FL=1